MFEKGVGLEFFKSKSGGWVPLIDGTLLHSSVNPEKEAQMLVDAEWDRLCSVQSIIVLGLGGGFHISEILARKSFHIVAIEPCRELTRALEEKWPALLSQVAVLGGIPPNQLYSEPAIQKAYSHSFAVFKHPASVRLSNYYFTAATKVLNQRTIEGLRKLTERHASLSRFLDSLDISGDQILTLPMVEEAMVRRGTGLDREGLIWMTMRELIV